MPAAFLGHGSPMNTLEHNRYTDAWRAWGASVPRPRAILAISAHWYINATAVTAMARPRVIHDFFGFPDELFAFDYPAPGAPDVAELVAEIAKPTWVGLDCDSWGLDHGTWSVLAHAFPDADVPVVQLSVDASKPVCLSRRAGRQARTAARPGRADRRQRQHRPQPAASRPARRASDGFDWAQRFDDAARALLQSKPEDIVALTEHPDFDLAVPTADHFLPMVYLAGLAAAAGTPTDVLIDGYVAGSLSMTSYTLAS